MYNFGFILSLVSAATYAYHMVLNKKETNRTVRFFWVSLFTYCGYLGLYTFSKLFFEHSNALEFESFLYETTFTNAPLYFLMALSWIGSTILLNSIIEKYDVSTIVPITKINIIFVTCGYLLLGQTTSKIELISAAIIALGALISGTTLVNKSNRIKSLLAVPAWLFIAVLLEAVLDANGKLITFLCTHKTATTSAIFSWLNDRADHLHGLSFSFRHPFYYNTGVRFFITTLFFAYLVIIKKHRILISELLNNKATIAFSTFILLTTTVTYHAAHQTTLDKEYIALIRKCSIPMLLILSHYMLNEKITAPKVIGCLVIMAGAFLTVL